VNGSAGRVAILHLDLDDADGAATDTTLAIEDIEARLTGTAADTLNRAFATSAFQAGQLLGEATVAGAVTS
jgi:hypothetical protein